MNSSSFGLTASRSVTLTLLLCFQPLSPIGFICGSLLCLGADQRLNEFRFALAGSSAVCRLTNDGAQPLAGAHDLSLVDECVVPDLTSRNHPFSRRRFDRGLPDGLDLKRSALAVMRFPGRCRAVRARCAHPSFSCSRAAMTTSWAFLPTSFNTGVTESDSPCTQLLHFLKLRGDLVASVSARLATRTGSLVSEIAFYRGLRRVDLGSIGHQFWDGRRSPAQERTPSHPVQAAGDGAGRMRIDVVRDLPSSAPSRLTATPCGAASGDHFIPVISDHDAMRLLGDLLYRVEENGHGPAQIASAK